MPNVKILSSAKIETLYAKLDTAHSASVTECIAAGWGMKRGDEIRALAAAGDRLAIRHVEACDARQEVIDEMSWRKRWSGTLKPVADRTA